MTKKLLGKIVGTFLLVVIPCVIFYYLTSGGNYSPKKRLDFAFVLALCTMYFPLGLGVGLHMIWRRDELQDRDDPVQVYSSRFLKY